MNVNDLIQRWMQSADLDGMPLPNLPIAEIVGDRRILIEYHQGIVHYSPESICVLTKLGQFWIEGSGLELAKMSKHQLIIVGTIDFVKIQRRNRNGS